MTADPETVADGRSLATALTPALIEATGGRLHDLNWFKADWQRGGAATGTAIFRHDQSGEQPVVVKFPVSTRELLWLNRLQNEEEPELVVPQLFSSGHDLGGYDFCWVVMERFPVGPLGAHWHDGHILRAARAVARFHAAAAKFEVDRPPRVEAWDDMIASSLKSARVNELPDEKEWIDTIKVFRNQMAPLVTEWRARDVSMWLHGDAHLANLMTRHSMESGAVALIDLAEVHAGHWLEDAVYLERLLWARPERLKPLGPVKAIARARRELGLSVEEDWPRLAMIRRGLLAATAPHFIRSEGSPRHLSACLKWLHRAVAELG